MDRIALLDYCCHVERTGLEIARDAHTIGSLVREGGLVDEAHLMRQAVRLAGEAQDHRDDLRVLRMALGVPVDPVPVVAPEPVEPAPVPVRRGWRFWRW